MKKIILYGSWFCLYVVCVALGYIVPTTDLQKIAMITFAVLFFIPPAWLAIDALCKEDKKTLCILRWVSGISLLLTVIFLVLNVISALFSEATGNLLYEALIIVSAPMICCQQWMVSLFLWACLFFATLYRKTK